MSVSGYQEISTVDEDEDDHDHDDDRRTSQQIVKAQKLNGFSFSSSLGKKAKSLILRPFRRKPAKTKTLILNRGSSSSSGNGGCYLCFKPSSTVESGFSDGSPISDPNDPRFTFEMLRVLIERNDFQSQLCNTHLDSDASRD